MAESTGVTSQLMVRVRALLWSIPALLAFAIALGVLRYARRQRSEAKLWCFASMRRAVATDELATANICMLHALDLGSSLVDVRYEYALAIGARHEYRQRAAALMRALAPRDRPGYPPAHRWLARYHWDARADPAVAAACEVHVRRALEADARDVEALGMLADLLMARLAYDEAARYVRASHALGATGDGGLLCFLHRWVQLMPPGKERIERILECRRLAERMIERGEQRMAESPRDESERIRFAAALAYVGQLHAAVRLLEGGRRMDPTARSARVLADAYRLLAPSQAPRVQVELLVKSLALAPLSLRGAIALVRAEDAGAPGAREAAQRHLAEQPSGERAGQRDAVYGMALMAVGRTADALPYLERSYELLGFHSPAGTGNLAQCLMAQPEPDYGRALALVDTALARRLEKPEYLRPVRARVLIGLKQWRQAIHDLERSLSIVGLRRRAEVLDLLARCYAALGERKLAELYELRARIEEQIAPRQPTRPQLDRGLQWLEEL